MRVGAEFLNPTRWREQRAEGFADVRAVEFEGWDSRSALTPQIGPPRGTSAVLQEPP
jgi:hypothetical protein